MRKKITILMVLAVAYVFSATITWAGHKEIVSDFTVGSGDVLIIEPGTIIRCAQDVKLTVNGGGINSMGTETDPVLFTALDRGDLRWEGIELNFAGNSEFNYTDFYFMTAPDGSGKAGMTLTGSPVSISNCCFSRNNGEYGGAVKIAGGNVTIQNSDFNNNNSLEGGAVFVFNNQTSSSVVNINKCEFVHNDGGSKGGAVCIMDNSTAALMDLNITYSDFSDNFSGLGGAVYYQHLGKINAEISKCKFFSNSSDWGSAIYAKFMPIVSGSILPQRFANLLVFKNGGFVQSGIYIDMGFTQNPLNLTFTNTTIAFNSLRILKSKADYKCGIYIKSNGNYPTIRNTILWSNTDFMGLSNFFIEDSTNPQLNNIFKYCDIQNYTFGGTNISSPPIFINPPSSSEFEIFEIDRYDLHESIYTPCKNTGDPEFTDPDGSRLNIGAYGGTNEAAKSNVVPVTTNFNIPSNTAGVFSTNGGTIVIDNINLSSNSQFFVNSQEPVEFIVRSITTPSGKFDGYVSIEPLRIDNQTIMVPLNFTVSENLNLTNTKLYNAKMKVQKETNPVNVNLNGVKSYIDPLASTSFGLEVIDADIVNIENSQFIDYRQGGIRIGTSVGGSKNKEKASGRVANNTVSFDADVASKDLKSVKRVGIEVANANIDIENNEINGGDEGIVMKSGSSGRVTNNTVSFDADVASKKGLYDKTAIIISDNSYATEIFNNTIINNDYSNTNVTGIEINGSKANINYNTLGFEGWSGSGTSRIGIKLFGTTDTTRVYNNTIYNTLQAFSAAGVAALPPIIIANNIYWSDRSSVLTMDDYSSARFYNNCLIDSLPVGIFAVDNIYSDPMLNAVWVNDYTLDSSSPCVNAGMVIDGLHVFSEGKSVNYYGMAPDIGAKELYQELTAPSISSTTVSAGNITIKWDKVLGFDYYIIYSSDNPYSGFSAIGYTTNEQYSATIVTKKFYYIVASNQPLKGLDLITAGSENSDYEEVKNTLGKNVPIRRNIIIKQNADR